MIMYMDRYIDGFAPLTIGARREDVFAPGPPTLSRYVAWLGIYVSGCLSTSGVAMMSQGAAVVTLGSG
jgi:hypothetical protein